jgi:hypothetical protein
MRSTVVDDAGVLRISIPMKRTWVALFVAVWLILWTYGGTDVGRKLLHRFDPGAFLWMCFWVVAECFAVYFLLRTLAGSDTINANAGEFRLRKQVFGIGVTRTYLVSEMRDLRFQPEMGGGRSRRASRIAFNYGAKTISFGEEIEEAEAAQLVSMIEARCNIAHTAAATEVRR